jgi:hypothetical protein
MSPSRNRPPPLSDNQRAVLEAVAREIDDLFSLVREANNQQPIILGFRRLSAAIRKRLAAAEPAAQAARNRAGKWYDGRRQPSAHAP